MCQWSIWVKCLSKMAEWQTLPQIELTKDKSSSPLVSKIVRWVTRKTGSPIYIRQIHVPKPAQPTIRPFPRFVLNLASCVEKSDANLLRPRYVASRPSIRTHHSLCVRNFQITCCCWIAPSGALIVIPTYWLSTTTQDQIFRSHRSWVIP